MDLTQHGFLDEFLAPRRDQTWNSFNDQSFNMNGWSFDSFDENPSLSTSSNPSSFLGLISSPADHHSTIIDQSQPFSRTDEPYSSFHVDGFTAHTPPPPPHDQYFPPLLLHHGEELNLDQHNVFSLEEQDFKVEMEEATTNITNQGFQMGLCGEKIRTTISTGKSKKVEGQPSKNLMAERRRRKRLNDRLSMLRSIVPKISKMDRTATLADTIDYMKELQERINNLQEKEEVEEGSNPTNLITTFAEKRFKEVLFEVETREADSRIEICCAAKPGILLSTINTLEALGLEIQHSVISCFNDFSLQASCSEVKEQITGLNSEDIKQALFRNAGYGGRCL
ncbi:transcription factor bHLH93-like isoform X2 [Tripterygium wilfordii]|uniref:transcription factor bHLH93-like isoform X2 n=1 Tax=Tripterygium wilfordii TaxID=458696 RepID=UPI0018F7F2AD|nr:transcription factor bHLH93-like isoform X2 [Tripterygium wilfordii]